MDIPLGDVSGTNPMMNGVLDETERMKKILDMRKPPLFQSNKKLNDTRVREWDDSCNKITQYSLHSLRVYRALLISSRTFLTQVTLILILILTVTPIVTLIVALIVALIFTLIVTLSGKLGHICVSLHWFP